MTLVPLTVKVHFKFSASLTNNKGDIYGYAYASTGFNFPYAISYHDAFLNNYAKVAVKYDCEFKATSDDTIHRRRSNIYRDPR